MTQEEFDKRSNALLDLGPVEGYMLTPWLVALRVSMRRLEIVEAFRKDTGIIYRPGLGADLEKFISSEKGYEFLVAFIKWFNKNVWGEADGRAISGDEIEVPMEEIKAKAEKIRDRPRARVKSKMRVLGNKNIQ